MRNFDKQAFLFERKLYKQILFNLTGYHTPVTRVGLYLLLQNSSDISMDSVTYISDGALRTMT